VTDPTRTKETWRIGSSDVEVVVREAKRIEDSDGKFPPLEPGTSVSNGIRVDRDVAVPLRDGITIYVDIYRPAGIETDLPSIIAWSPYGKRVGYVGRNDVRGVPITAYSEGTKTEGPDPDYWCRQGYALVNPDARGAGNSEGTTQFWTSTEGKDEADLVEWLAAQPWSNGRVGMSGNSWLSVSQWFSASERPPHLSCIAPWEGLSDVYRDLAMRGGIPETGFMSLLMSFMTGPGLAEDIVASAEIHPMLDEYWKDKIAAVENIDVPAYVAAGWSHFHLMGSIGSFRKIASEEKWLRIHRDFEWPDYYAPENLADLTRFFERYLKGHHNGWELTPRVRVDVMDRGDQDHVVRRAEKEFPLIGTEYRSLYLDASTSGLSRTRPTAQAEVEYESSHGRASFDMVFDEDTELTGYMKLRLWVEARGHDDLDLFIAVTKADESGLEIPTLVMDQPYPGASGMMRVSHRALDEARSSIAEPFHPHEKRLPLTPGEIVPVDIPIWPSSRFWHAGESIRVIVAGGSLRDPGWFEPFEWDVRNSGTHVIHTGAEYDSQLVVPFIPARRPVVYGGLLEPSRG
jgi:predicted acyl esterase